MFLVYVNHADVYGVQYGLEFKEQVHAPLPTFNPAKFPSLSLICGPYIVSSFVKSTQLAPRVICGLCFASQVLCTQDYTQTLFYFYKIHSSEISGVLHIKIHGF